MSATTFSSPGQDVIARTIQIDEAHTRRAVDLDSFYQVQRTADEILAGNFNRVALQFPDELLGDSVPVFRALKSRVSAGREIYVLADTSYGSCCVDEVAAQHVDADVVVHYGYACLSQTSHLPVIYVFGKKMVDLDHAISSLLEVMSPTEDAAKILLKSDVIYSHLIGEFVEKARAVFLSRNANITYTPLPLKTAPRSSNTSDALESNEPESYSTIFYIGGETLALTNLLMTNPQSQVISYNPDTKNAKIESSRTNRMLMRRYAVVQKARDADVFGILVGTLGVASYLPLIKHLRSLLSQHHKKSYTISVGKLNPAKLANFMEIECFVLVACPENSLVDSKEFYQPIVTPYELEIALGAGRSWTGEYVLDFDQILKESSSSSGDGQNERPQVDDGGGAREKDEDVQSEEEGGRGKEGGDDIDQPVFSLVTGKYRQAKRYGAPVVADSTNEQRDASFNQSLAIRSQDDALVALPNSAALQFLHQRSYQGLEVRQGEDEPGVLEQGRSGIARGYQTDRGV